MVPSGDWFTVSQTAKYFGVSRRTIYNWLDAKKMETKRDPGGRIRIRVTSVLNEDATRRSNSG